MYLKLHILCYKILCSVYIAVSLNFVEFFNAAVNGKLELTLLKGRQRFDTISTSNLKV